MVISIEALENNHNTCRRSDHYVFALFCQMLYVQVFLSIKYLGRAFTKTMSVF